MRRRVWIYLDDPGNEKVEYQLHPYDDYEDMPPSIKFLQGRMQTFICLNLPHAKVHRSVFGAYISDLNEPGYSFGDTVVAPRARWGEIRRKHPLERFVEWRIESDF